MTQHEDCLASVHARHTAETNNRIRSSGTASCAARTVLPARDITGSAGRCLKAAVHQQVGRSSHSDGGGVIHSLDRDGADHCCTVDVAVVDGEADRAIRFVRIL